MSLSQMYDILHGWLQGLNMVWEFFTTPIKDMTSELLTESFLVPPEAADVIAGIAGWALPADANLLTIMLGSLVVWYLGYQLLTWFGNLIT